MKVITKKISLVFISILLAINVFAQETGIFTDPRDNKVYKTIKYGEQTWFAQNLSFECENSFVYDNLIENEAIYGRLYTYKAAASACPVGWHLPDRDEWLEFNNYIIKNFGYDKNSVAFLAIKSKELWDKPGNNKSGFNALPAGFREGASGKFMWKGSIGLFWQKVSPERPGYFTRILSQADLSYPSDAWSVRCIKD